MAQRDVVNSRTTGRLLVEYRMYDNPELPILGKMILRVDTPEERERMNAFRAHVTSPQRGPTFEIVFWRRKRVGPEGVAVLLHQAVAKEEPSNG